MHCARCGTCGCMGQEKASQWALGTTRNAGRPPAAAALKYIVSFETRYASHSLQQPAMQMHPEGSHSHAALSAPLRTRPQRAPQVAGAAAGAAAGDVRCCACYRATKWDVSGPPTHRGPPDVWNPERAPRAAPGRCSPRVASGQTPSCRAPAPLRGRWAAWRQPAASLGRRSHGELSPGGGACALHTTLPLSAAACWPSSQAC